MLVNDYLSHAASQPKLVLLVKRRYISAALFIWREKLSFLSKFDVVTEWYIWLSPLRSWFHGVRFGNLLNEKSIVCVFAKLS